MFRDLTKEQFYFEARYGAQDRQYLAEVEDWDDYDCLEDEVYDAICYTDNRTSFKLGERIRYNVV